MNKRIPFVLCLSALILASQLSASDGQRKGFILGGGVGYGALSLGMDEYGVNAGALATNFIIGYAPSASWEIYYTNNVSWFSDRGNTERFVVTGLGMTKYLKRAGGGLYFCGGIGLSVQTLYGGSTGFGALAGIGYDVARHWRVQGEIMLGEQVDGPIWSIRATLNVIAF